jgi:NDP-sugar pyrophosphorylase family protein
MNDGPIFSVSNYKFNIIILAAGQGTRLRPETEQIPKALVQLGSRRAIDHLIGKYEHVAGKFIIAVGYCADLLENYCRGKYRSLPMAFSREEVGELAGPGNSLVLALDHASSRLPTLITFCDFVIEDQFNVDQDAIGVCSPEDPEAVLDGYKTVAEVVGGKVTRLIPNPDPKVRANGFTGTLICQQTKLLKSIAYSASCRSGSVDYAMDVVNPYIHQVAVGVRGLRRMFEFGTDESLRKTRKYLDGTHEYRRQPALESKTV